jgi:5-methylcytosine-specific restriction enzyme A
VRAADSAARPLQPPSSDAALARRRVRGTVRLHQICHSAIHARYSEVEIARRFADVDSLKADPELARFAAWVCSKPADFHARTRRAKRRNR